MVKPFNGTPARLGRPSRSAIPGILSRYFRHAWPRPRTGEVLLISALLLITAVLCIISSGFEKPSSASRAAALILETDDAGVRAYGPLLQGEQLAKGRIMSGPFKGMELEGTNFLFGKMDQDKLFSPGDLALAVIDPAESGGVAAVTFQEHYRLRAEILLALAFAALLLLYGGWTGLRTLAAFAFTAVGIWKLLVPAILAGINPLPASLAMTAVLILAIAYAVAGFTRAGSAAVLGSLLGVGASALIGLLMAEPFELNGAVRTFAETLVYSGFDHINLRELFLAGTFLACSGAIVDLAIDVAVAMEEVKAKRPSLGFIGLLSSGLSVGRKVFGTMTTTLLLAYSGGFMALLMVFMAQGVPMVTMFNLSYISSEVFHTLVGSLGLVLVAPLTALTAAALFSRHAVKDGHEG